MLPKPCSAARPGPVGCRHVQCQRGSPRKLVADEVLHPIGKIQPVLIGLNAPDRVESC